MKLKAVFDSIILEKVEQGETSYGSIVVPDMGKEKHILADVIDVGPGRRNVLNGELISTSIKVGDRVIIPQVGITQIEHEDKEYIACDEGKVLAIVNK
jgi:co-chaperonin GroES (HSP10)